MLNDFIVGYVKMNYLFLIFQISVAFAALNVLTVFIPETTRPSNTAIHQSIHTQLNRDVLLLSIGFMTPILCDLLWATIRGRLVSINDALVPRWLLVFSLQICDIIVFRSLNTNDAGHIKPRVCTVLQTCKLAAFVTCASAIICKQSKSIMMEPAFSPALQRLLLVLVSAFLHMCSVLGYESWIVQDSYFRYVVNSVFCLMTTQVAVLCINCFYRLLQKHVDSPGNASFLSGEDVVVAICLLMLFLRVLSSTIFACLYESFEAHSRNTLICDFCIQSIAVLGITVLPWRIHEWGILRFLETLVRDNSSFLRYIAHEVRSPLNIAQLSISFLKAETSGLTLPGNEGKYDAVVEAIADVESGCQAAVSMLSDVLEFDKMKGKPVGTFIHLSYDK